MLTGLRILNTRPPSQAKTLTHRLQSLGAEVVELPLFNIVPLPFTFPNLSSYAIAIFVSQNAVRPFFSHPAYKSWPQSCAPIAMGEATGQALSPYQLEPILPEEAHSEALLDLKILANPQNKQILLIKGKNGRALIADTLTQKGAIVTSCDVYERQAITYPPDKIQTIWQEDRIDIILLTSQEVIELLLTLFGEAGALWVKNKPCLVVSDRLQKLAQEKGFQQVQVTTPNQIIEGLSSLVIARGEAPKQSRLDCHGREAASQ